VSFASYLGGAQLDSANHVYQATDIFITGRTASNNFPVSNAFQGTRGGGPSDAFLTRVNSAGAVIFSTFLGGTGTDVGYAVTVDIDGNIIVVGATDSATFPTTGPSFGPVGGLDCFISKFNSSGQGLLWSTLLGGSNDDSGNCVAVDSQRNIYVAGVTASDNFPVISPIFSNRDARNDVFVAIISSTNSLIFSTYLGGSGDEHPADVAIDLSGNIFLFGETDSSNFPVRGITSSSGGRTDTFFAKVGVCSQTRQLEVSRYLGGSQDDNAGGLSFDASSGMLYVTGTTSSNNFPLVNPFKSTITGGTDAFVAQLNANGAILFSSLLGGRGAETATDVQAVSGAVYVVGSTASDDFPRVAAFQSNYGGGGDAFLTKLQVGTFVLTSGSTTSSCTTPEIRCPCGPSGECNEGLECRSLVCVEILSGATTESVSFSLMIVVLLFELLQM
jgi:hypothetical protein